MRVKRFALGGIMLALLATGGASPTAGQPPAAKVLLRAVSYSELGDLVRTFKGKVVVVDFWADT